MNDRMIVDHLASVHAQGAKLYDKGDHAGCCCFFQGMLMTVQFLLPEELQQRLDKELNAASKETNVSIRALMLHGTIENLQKKLKEPPPSNLAKILVVNETNQDVTLEIDDAKIIVKSKSSKDIPVTAGKPVTYKLNGFAYEGTKRVLAQDEVWTVKIRQMK